MKVSFSFGPELPRRMNLVSSIHGYIFVAFPVIWTHLKAIDVCKCKQMFTTNMRRKARVAKMKSCLNWH